MQIFFALRNPKSATEANFFCCPWRDSFLARQPVADPEEEPVERHAPLFADWGLWPCREDSPQAPVSVCEMNLQGQPRHRACNVQRLFASCRHDDT